MVVSSCFRLGMFIWSFSHGKAMTFGHCSKVLRLNLGSSHGCGLEFRSLDLLVILNHNQIIVIWVFWKGCWVYEEKSHSLSVFRARASLCLNENVVPDNFRVLTFWWIGTEGWLSKTQNAKQYGFGSFAGNLW